MKSCKDNSISMTGDECHRQVKCLYDTGDFRIFIGDRGGYSINKDGFGSISDISVSEYWKGVSWYTFPHSYTNLTKCGGDAIPCSIWYQSNKNKKNCWFDDDDTGAWQTSRYER